MSQFFPNPDEMGRHTLFPGVLIQTMAQDRMLVSVVDLEPHSSVPLHSHPHEQVGYVVHGRMTFTIGDEVKVVGPGDVYRIPGGVTHGVQALDEPVRAIDIFSPVREEYL